MQMKEKIELSSIEATAYWWVNIIKYKVREIDRGGVSSENEYQFCNLFFRFTEREWRDLYLELINFITLNVNNYVPTGNEFGIDAFHQDTDRKGHDELNIALAKILDKPSIPDIRLASNSLKDSVIYTNIFGASVWYKSGGLTDLPIKYEPTYILTGNEEELYLRNLLLATIIILEESDKNFHSTDILREVFCQEYKCYIKKEKIDEVYDLFNDVFDKLNDDKKILGRHYHNNYYATILNMDYVGLIRYIDTASNIAHKVLECNLNNDKNYSKKLKK